MVPGGVMVDIHPNFQRKVKEFITHFKNKIDEYDELVTGNVIFQNRMKGVGYISKEDATLAWDDGPFSREVVFNVISGNYIHMRYHKVQFDEIIETEGDSFARYMVRMKEMRQSLSIVEQLIDNTRGRFPGKNKSSTEITEGEFYSRIETARGEFGVYIVSEGGTTPYRISFGHPFSNLSALDHMARGGKISDLIAMMGTLTWSYRIR